MQSQTIPDAATAAELELPWWKVVAITLVLAGAGVIVYYVFWRACMRLFGRERPPATPPDGD